MNLASSLQQPLSITVVVPIKNEAANLPRCLSQLGDFAHVLVIDSGSTDGSVEIAREYGAQVLAFAWDGQFPKKRNWCLRTYDFQTAWVLFLDADEQVTPAFVREVARAIRDEKFNGYWVTYPTYFMGRLLRHGDKLVKLPLLRVGHGEYERIEENAWSALDMEIHEHLVVQGAVGEIAAPIIHHDFKGLTAYYERHNQYSSWEARRYFALRRARKTHWTLEQKVKYRLLGQPFFAPLYFVAAYIFKAGFLDGVAGLRLAIAKTFYFHQIYCKIAELRRKKDVR